MPISTLPTPPSRADDPSNFSSKSDALLGALPTFVTETNAAVTVINAASANVDAAMAAGLANAAANATTATTQAGIATTKAGEAATSATNANNSAIASAAIAASIAGGPVASVNGKTGVAVLLPSDIAANATQAEMEAGTETGIRSLSPLRVAQAIASLVPNSSVGNHFVTAHTGNGHGSTATSIRRFSTVLGSAGTAVAYADSASQGASFTISEDGIYAVRYWDEAGGSFAAGIGVSKNSSELTTAIKNNAIASVLAVTRLATSAFGGVSVVERLSIGDVIRPHTDGTPASTTPTSTYFSIRKVGS